MKCIECGAYCIEVRGELSCQSCGLVGERVFEPVNRFDAEQLVRHKDTVLGSKIGNERMKGASKLRRLAVTTGLTKRQQKMKQVLFYTNIVASEFGLSESAKTDIRIYYEMLIAKHIFTTRMRYEERLGALCYIVLREHGYTYTLKEVSKTLEITPKKISKLSRLYARHLGKSQVFSNASYASLLEKFCSNLGLDRSFTNDCVSLYCHLDSIDSVYPSSAYLSGIIYFVESTRFSRTLTQKSIAKELNVGVTNIKNQNKRILNLLNIEDSLGVSIDDIVEGIR